jgi:hypothetical protein
MKTRTSYILTEERKSKLELLRQQIPTKTNSKAIDKAIDVLLNLNKYGREMPVSPITWERIHGKFVEETEE